MRKKIKQIIETFKYKDGEDRKEWYSVTVSALFIVFYLLFIILFLIVKLILKVVI